MRRATKEWVYSSPAFAAVSAGIAARFIPEKGADSLWKMGVRFGPGLRMAVLALDHVEGAYLGAEAHSGARKPSYTSVLCKEMCKRRQFLSQ